MKKINHLAAIALIAVIIGCSGNPDQPDKTAIKDAGKTEQKNMPSDTLKKRLIRAGELEVSGKNMAELHSYFDTANFRFHGPDKRESNYAQLNSYFRSYRAAFDDLSIKRGLMIREGNYIACQTWIEGTFVRPFTLAPYGKIPPNGHRVIRELMNIFRFDDQGKLVEEWVQLDNRSYLRQLGVEGK